MNEEDLDQDQALNMLLFHADGTEYNRIIASLNFCNYVLPTWSFIWTDGDYWFVRPGQFGSPEPIGPHFYPEVSPT